MSRPALEVADIFRDHGAAWRKANAGHVSLDQMKVMSAIERCRTAALGGHVARCEGCAHTVIAYNSCRNRHCPKCQGTAAKEWLAAREADLLPVPYFHVVFTLPAKIIGVIPMTALRMIKRGDLKGRQLCRGAPWVIKAEDVVAFVGARPDRPLTANPAQKSFEFSIA